MILEDDVRVEQIAQGMRERRLSFESLLMQDGWKELSKELNRKRVNLEKMLRRVESSNDQIRFIQGALSVFEDIDMIIKRECEVSEDAIMARAEAQGIDEVGVKEESNE